MTTEEEFYDCICNKKWEVDERKLEMLITWENGKINGSCYHIASANTQKNDKNDETDNRYTANFICLHVN